MSYDENRISDQIDAGINTQKELWELKTNQTVLINALKQIEQMSDGGDYFTDIMKMKSIATDALNELNKTQEGK